MITRAARAMLSSTTETLPRMPFVDCWSEDETDQDMLVKLAGEVEALTRDAPLPLTVRRVSDSLSPHPHLTMVCLTPLDSAPPVTECVETAEQVTNAFMLTRVGLTSCEIQQTASERRAKWLVSLVPAQRASAAYKAEALMEALRDSLEGDATGIARCHLNSGHNDVTALVAAAIALGKTLKITFE